MTMTRTAIKTFAKTFAKDEDGATAIEYGLFAALVGAVIVGTIATLGGQTNSGFVAMSDELTAAGFSEYFGPCFTGARLGQRAPHLFSQQQDIAMPFDTSSPAPSTYAAFVCTDQGAEVARSVFAQSGQGETQVYGGGLSGAARLGDAAPVAQTILTEIGNINVDMAVECVTEICKSGVNVIVLGEQTDIATYRALLRAGAAEYFSFPVTADDILHVPTQEVETPVVTAPQPVGVKTHSIAVMGSNGGVGASQLAQNLAFHAAGTKDDPKQTALLDGDLQFGTLAIDLDRDETPGFFEALMAPDRVDETLIAATMDHLTDHLSLYSRQVGLGQDATSFETGLPRLIDKLRDEFDVLVTDLPRQMLMQDPSLSDHFDALVLVIPAGFSGVSAASRLIKRIAAQSPDLLVLPVLSDLRPDAKLSLKDVRNTIERDMITTLPRCDAQMSRAQRNARPLIQTQARGPYAKAVRTIWDAAQTEKRAATDPTKHGLLKRIFG